MGRRGPKPKPTAIKAAAGNPGRRPLNDDEPLPPVGEIKPPAWISERGRAVWNDVAPICIAMRTLTTADVFTFARYCEALARWVLLKKYLFDREADDLRAAMATVYPLKDKDGNPRYMQEFPQAAEWRKLDAMLCRLEQAFGLNASARSVLKISGGSGTAAASPAAAPVAGPPGSKLGRFLHETGVFKFPAGQTG